MSAEAIVGIVGIVLGAIGFLTTAAVWGGRLLAEVKNLNANLTRTDAENRDDHGAIWNRLDDHGKRLTDHGERIVKLGG